MHTKTIIVKTDWLSEIAGMKVADAIAYLETLDQDKTLDCYIDGDTHGCDLVSRLTYEEPLSNQEIRVKLEKHYAKQMDHFQKVKCYYLKNGIFSRLENCALQIRKLRDLRDTALSKYPI